MQVEIKKVQDLQEDPENVRAHDSRNIRVIKESLERFGQQKPIVINEEGRVIAGNGTLQAAKEIGWEEIQVVCTKLDSEAAKAFAIVDNRSNELSDWDEEALLNDLVNLMDSGIDIESIGFSNDEIEELSAALDKLGPMEVEVSENQNGFLKSKEEYEAQAIRQMVMHFPQEQYPALIEAMEKEMESRGVPNYSLVLVGLLKDNGYEVD